MHWAAPHNAWLALLLLPAGALQYSTARARRRILGQLTQVSGNTAPLPELARLTLLALAYLCLVAALCRPQWGEVTTQQQGRGLDILVALDVSRSMLADDIHPNRLTAAKDAVSSLVQHLRGDRIGLLAFAGNAFLVCPLTRDYTTFEGVLKETGPETLPLGGTHMANMLSEAERAFTGPEAAGRALIVISDGEDHDDATSGVQSIELADALRKKGIRVFGVVVGTTGGGLVPLAKGDFLRNREGKIVNSHMALEPLRSITQRAGGRLLNLTTTPNAMEHLVDEDLAALGKASYNETRKQPAERYQYPLALAIVLLAIESLLMPRRST